MKKTITFLLSVTFLLQLPAQNQFEREVSKAVKYLERNLSVDNRDTAARDIEFFIYDISCDSNGKVMSVHLLIMDSLTSAAKARMIGNEIMKNFNFGKSNFKKLMIPVMVIQKNQEDETDRLQEPLLETIAFYDQLARKKTGKVYVSRKAVIAQYAHKKRGG